MNIRPALAILAAALLVTACADPVPTTRRVLASQGYTDITASNGWFDGFNCSDSDTWSVSFEATGVNGQRVNGTVCGGYIGKGATVRFN